MPFRATWLAGHLVNAHWHCLASHQSLLEASRGRLSHIQLTNTCTDLGKVLQKANAGHLGIHPARTVAHSNDVATAVIIHNIQCMYILNYRKCVACLHVMYLSLMYAFDSDGAEDHPPKQL
jgi:hypothetical protein